MSGDPVICLACGALFACDPIGDCWCKKLPAIHPVPQAASGCLCPTCLERRSETAPPHAMDYLPIFLDVRGEQVLVVGGGEAAMRKISLLLAAGARVKVVSANPSQALTDLAASGVVGILHKGFEPADLTGAVFAIAATDDAVADASVAEAARERSLPVNVVDRPELCSFIMPSIIQRGRITVAVSTGGASPVLARQIRLRLEAALPSGIERLVDLAASWRAKVKDALPDGRMRQLFWEEFLGGPWAERVMGGETPDLAESLENFAEGQSDRK